MSLYAVHGDSPTVWVLDWQGSGHGESLALRVRGVGGNVGMHDNRWFHLLRLSARNPDDPAHNLWWEIRVGWRHRWELPYEAGWFDQTACTAIDAATREQVDAWLVEAKAAPHRPISPQMDPTLQVPPELRHLLGLDAPTSTPVPEGITSPDDHDF
jgi:hypothetical protein